jgi:hypothetical protein
VPSPLPCARAPASGGPCCRTPPRAAAA